jgi:predicted membrane channel-forming protein YqfA (hemolysin III family)
MSKHPSPSKPEIATMSSTGYQAWKTNEVLKNLTWTSSLLISGLIAATIGTSLLYTYREIGGALIMFAIAAIVAAPLIILYGYPTYTKHRKELWKIRESV